MKFKEPVFSKLKIRAVKIDAIRLPKFDVVQKRFRVITDRLVLPSENTNISGQMHVC